MKSIDVSYFLKRIVFIFYCIFSNMMDEQLIDEVAQHAVIYNRQKYYLNGSINSTGPVAANKYETKDEAWSSIAMKLRSDVETCKKRWKYLRERYVSQRKQGDPPVYEHLSRPYLEKMKFLDSHIQPRKSYRNVPNFLTSPHSANSSNFNDYNMDSKSNSSIKCMGHFGQHGHHFQDQQHAMNALSSAAAAASAMEGDSRVKLEADQVFRDFAAAVASQHLQQISQSQMHHQQTVAAMTADSSQNYGEHYRENAGSVLSNVLDGPPINGSGGGVGVSGSGNSASGLHSSSSSIKSPLSSPLGASSNHNVASAGHSTTSTQQVAAHSSSNTAGNGGGSGNSNNHFNNHSFNDTHNDDLDSSTSSTYNMKKPRVQLIANTLNSSASSQLHQTTNSSHHNSHNNLNSTANNSHFANESDEEDTDDNSPSLLQPQTMLNEHQQTAENPFQTMVASTSSAAVALQRSHSNSTMNNINSINNHNNNSQSTSSNMFSSNADFLFQLYQQLPQHHHSHQQQHNSNVSQSQQFNKFQVPPAPQPTIQRSSEHLLGELVTTELLKMSKERRKIVQKRILEILFFDD